MTIEAINPNSPQPLHLDGLIPGDAEFLREAALDAGRYELAGRILAAQRPPVEEAKAKAKPPVKRAARKVASTGGASDAGGVL